MNSTEEILGMLQDLDASLKMQAVTSSPGNVFVGPSVAELAANRIEFLTQQIKELEADMELKLNEAEVQRLNLQPDEILVVKVKSDELTQAAMAQLRKGMSGYFPNNKILVLGVGEEGSIDLTVAKGSAYPETNYCSDCNCGKKAAFEGNGNETT